MAVGRIRAIIIIALFATSASIPILMESSIVPMLNMLNFIEQFVDIEYDQDGNPISLNIKYDAILNSIKRIECLTDESNENQTCIQITLNVTNTDPFEFDMLIPGIDMTVYWKAGLPYAREKDTILNWTNDAFGATDKHPEPVYDRRRWTRVVGLKMDATRIKPGIENQENIRIKIYLYNDELVPGQSSALGQMLGTILRTQSTEDPISGETLLHLSGSASLDIPGFSFPLSLPLGLDLSGFLNISSLLGGLGGDGGGGGAGNGGEAPNMFDLLFDVPLNIFDIQNYNDSNGNFVRDFSGIDNVTQRKIWTEELYQHGAISAFIYMDLKDQLGVKNLNITLLKSSHNPDDANLSHTWDPEIAAEPQDKNTIANQLFVYIPDSPYLYDSSWGDKILAVLGFPSDLRIYDWPTGNRPDDLGSGKVIAGTTLRLTGDLRQNSNFTMGDGIGAMITQLVEGILPIGVFGSVDLMLNEMPLSLCLDLPMPDLNISSLLGDLMGGDEGDGEGGGSGDVFSMLLDYLGLNTVLLNGLAFDVYKSILQLNMTLDLDMFLPYGIYMPEDPVYDESGEEIPYIGVGGGPIQIFDEELPENLNGQRFAIEYSEIPTVVNATHLQLSRGNVSEIVAIFNGTYENQNNTWWDAAHPNKNFTTDLTSTLIYVDTAVNNDSFVYNYTAGNNTYIQVIYKRAEWKTAWWDEHLVMNLTLDSDVLRQSMANLMKTIGSTDQGDGIAYLFDDGNDTNGDHGNLLDFLIDNQALPNPDDDNSFDRPDHSFQVTEDQFKLDLTEIVPDFGQGLYTLIDAFGVDPLFIQYINNSIPHNNSKTIIEDLLSFRQILDIIYKDGPANDLFDYLMDSNITYSETAELIDGKRVQVSHWGLKDVIRIQNGTYDWWDKYTQQVWDNGTIYIDTTVNDWLNESGVIQVEYITNKLELFDASNLVSALLNLTFGAGDSSGGGGGGGGGGISEELLSTIIRYLPGTLDAMGIDFDRLLPGLLEYLRVDISHPPPVGYGIKPFELLDVAFGSMGGGESAGDVTSDLMSGFSDEFIDNLMEQVVYRFIEQADPFQLMDAAVGDLTPIIDYLNRSRIFSRAVLIPLIASLFPSGSSLEGIGGPQGESFDLGEIVDIIMPLITEMIIEGDPARSFEHGALNPFAWLTAPEAIEYHSLREPGEYQRLIDNGFSVYQVGFGNYTPDYPKYDNLRLISNLTLGLMMSGFSAADLWEIIDMLGLLESGDGDGGGGGGGSPIAGFESLIPLLGVFVPPTEWNSILRDIGIWSSWDGYASIQFALDLGFLGYWGPFEIGEMLGSLLNLEKLLATGWASGLFGMFDGWLLGIPLCTLENQSYGNPYTYIPGYDSSGDGVYGTGIYRDLTYGTSTTNNWGWVPLGWDPGGYWPSGYPVNYNYQPGPNQYPGGSGHGDPSLEVNYTAEGGSDYSKSFITKLASALPLEIDLPLPEFDFSGSFAFIDFFLWMAIQLNIYLRLEGNPSLLTYHFEDEGIPLMGIAGHFVGGDLAGLVTDMIDSLTGGGVGGGNATSDPFEFPDLDMVVLLQSFLNADVDILHYWKYIVDPEFMKASEWYLDSSYVDPFNSTEPTLVWDEHPTFGDNDGIADEFPWYRFEIPKYNQDPNLVDLGPGYPPITPGRNPPLVDYLTPDGPPGSGIWAERPDQYADGIQHYWYDTPYAYVNTTVKRSDPWVNIHPYIWNDFPGGDGDYHYWVDGTEYIWGDDPGEQVPLLQDSDGNRIRDEYWDDTGIPSLYLVPYNSSLPPAQRPTNWGVPGYATYYPIPEPDGSTGSYPNIWHCFNITLTQVDYRFGYWETVYDEVLGKDVTRLNIGPMYDMLSYAFYPQLIDLLDMIDIASLFESSGTGGAAVGDIATSMGIDYYHLLRHDDVYSKFGFDRVQPLNPFGLLQWLWDGAGLRLNENGTNLVPYVEPYTVPDLQGALDWLADHGFTMDFIITNLGQITDLLATEVESGGGGGGSNPITDMLSTDSIVSMINAIEEYMIQIVAENNLTKATEITLSIMRDMPSLLDFNPTKAIRGALNFLMPRLEEVGGVGGGGGGSSVVDANALDLGAFLEQSGLMDIIFVNSSKISDPTTLTLSIQRSSIDLYLFGQKIEDIPLTIPRLDLDISTLFGGGEEEEDGGTGGGEEADFMSSLPISFPEGGLPYIELSTFQGPFDIEFHLFNTSLSGVKNDLNNTIVTIGEVWWNENTSTYYLNRTQSGDEAGSATSGWSSDNRTYVRDELKVSDVTGRVQYSSVLEEDGFGWVDPYIYIHVEEPGDYPAGSFYWWNVTGHPVQRTLANNTWPYKARWVTDGREIIVQGDRHLFPNDTINIDTDPYWEIFARVEIDGRTMPTHEVVFVDVGTVQDIQVRNATGLPLTPYQVQINASYSETTNTWSVSMGSDSTRYIAQSELTPTGRSATYPTITEIISGFSLETDEWVDDSLYEVRIDYTNLTGFIQNLYTFRLASALGDDAADLVFTGVASSGPGYDWSLAGGTYLTFQFSPQEVAEVSGGGDYKYSIVDIAAYNFVNKTITNVFLDLNVTNEPYISGDNYWLPRYIYYDSMYSIPSIPTNYYFHQDIVAGNLVVQGNTPLNQMDATEAWFNFTVPISTSSFLNKIIWNISVYEDTLSDGNIADLIITYHNESTGQDVDLQRSTNLGYEDSDQIDSFGPFIDLYLTQRGDTAFENVSSVKFAVRLTEASIVPPDDGIGFINGTKIYNTSVNVQFLFYPFVSEWGLNSIEIPEGFISDFTLTVMMYDPFDSIDSPLNAANYPKVNVSYYLMGPLEHDHYLDLDVKAAKIFVYLEAWDSLVRRGGHNGDILFLDNQSSATKRLVPLSDYGIQPTLNTTIDVIDLEGRVYINVTIDADQTLRDFYLHLGIAPGDGYADRPHTGDYRFSIISPNTDVLKKTGAYASKKVLDQSSYGYTNSVRVGMVDLDASPVPYFILFTMTFVVSPEFIINSATETFIFKAVWSKAEGTYQLDPNDPEYGKQSTVTRSIDIVYN